MTNWWLKSRVDATVTRQFVTKHLSAEDAPKLDHQIYPFQGAASPRRCYWECIETRAKRLFLILHDIGATNQVFRLIDEGWDDGQLPLSTEAIARLRLVHPKDNHIERKFEVQQRQYTTKFIERGEHHNYDDSDLVPVESAERSTHLPTRNHSVEKVKLPNAPGQVFNRRKYPLGNLPGLVPVQEFLELVVAVGLVDNEHIVSYWGSYTHEGFGYILLTPVSDFNLKSFLSNAPSSFKSLPKKERRETIINWILCLVDTVCFLHSQERAHSHIKPSAILFTHQNHLVLADPTGLTPEVSNAHEKTTFDREWYDYAAPEQGIQRHGIGNPLTTKAIVASLSVSPEHVAPNYDPATASHAMYIRQSNQQGDIFSLGCIILELLSFLVKRSSSKFANYRSIKHKTGGRGGAVLDTSFHRHLGQVENWMSELAKEASKKISATDGGNVFRGFAPMLHVVAEMLATHPWERPFAYEVQERIYSIVVGHCGIEDPHCAHQSTSDLSNQLEQTHIQGVPPHAQFTFNRPQMQDMPPQDMNLPPLLHQRTNSSSGVSQFSRDSSITTGSSEHSAEITHPGARFIPGLAEFRRQPPDGQRTLYAAAPSG